MTEYLFWCNDCERYLNKKLYSTVCNEAHTAISRESPSFKCDKHHRLMKNCKICNPYNCPCGRVVANNIYTVVGHILTKYHIRHMKKKNLV